MGLAGILNFLQIYPNLATSGQPEPDQFAAIKEAGYEVLVNLVPPISPEALPEEAEIVAGLGLEYIHIPVLWDSPTLQDLEQFFQVLDANSGHKVFAHCVLNMRVSAFVFLYNVIRKGIPEEIARQSMLEIWEPNPTWESLINGALHAHRTTGS